MMSLIDKFKMYKLGRVRMSLLHMIMMIRIILPVVPITKGNAYTGNWYCLKKP